MSPIKVGGPCVQVLWSHSGLEVGRQKADAESLHLRLFLKLSKAAAEQ